MVDPKNEEKHCSRFIPKQLFLWLADHSHDLTKKTLCCLYLN